MGFEDILKLQLLQSNNSNGAQGLNLMSIFIQFFMFFLISIIDEIKKIFPKIYEFYYEKYIKKPIEISIYKTKDELSENTIKLTSKHSINKVYMTRIYEVPEKSDLEEYSHMNEIVDSVLEYVASLNNIPILEFIKNSSYLVMYKDTPIQITEDIYINIHTVTRKQLCTFDNIQIELLSETLTTKEITEWVNYIYNQYKINLENQLGNKIYYFDQYETKKPDILGDHYMKQNKNSKTMIKRAQLQQEPKFLTFHLQEFHSNKYFSNLYGKVSKIIYEKIMLFEKNPDFYIKKGLPRHLGIMLAGPPGLGKTAMIKCIANETKRHIINVNFKNIKTASQFKNLFGHSDISTISDLNNGVFKKITIPMEKRLYVLEEIDAITDIVKQRTNDGKDKEEEEEVVEEELTLGEILTELDGTLERPGRMIIITSNHPESIDSALLRPGRIDIIIKFERVDKEETIEMIEKFLDIKISKKYYDTIPDKKLTFAELQEILLKYLDIDRKNFDEMLVINDINNFRPFKQQTQDNVVKDVVDIDVGTNSVVNNPVVKDDDDIWTNGIVDSPVEKVDDKTDSGMKDVANVNKNFNLSSDETFYNEFPNLKPFEGYEDNFGSTFKIEEEIPKVSNTIKISGVPKIEFLVNRMSISDKECATTKEKVVDTFTDSMMSDIRSAF